MKPVRVSMIAVVLGLLVAVPGAWAQDPIHKMGRGIVNVLTGWIEMPRQMQLGSRETNPLVGASMGLAKGVGLTILRMGVGAYEAVTCPIPYPGHFDSPYQQMELPDYAWE